MSLQPMKPPSRTMVPRLRQTSSWGTRDSRTPVDHGSPIPGRSACFDMIHFPSCSLVTIALLAHKVLGVTDFEISCTLPTDADHVNFVSAPNLRSTLDIVWAVLSIFLLCTWNAIHLSVPSHFENFGEGFSGRVKEKWQRAKEKGLWMLVMVVSPEYLFGKGMMENFAARQSVKLFADPKRWTNTHAYFANMRGLVLKFKIKGPKRDLTPTGTGKASELGLSVTKFSKDAAVPYQEQDLERAKQIDLEYCRATCHPLPKASDKTKATITIKSEGIYQEADSDVPASVTFDRQPLLSSLDIEHQISQKPGHMPEHEEWEGTWALNAAQWHQAWLLGLVGEPPRVTVEEIRDRSKGDGLAKGLAVLQISWLVIQVIARAIEGLAVSLLEVTVLAFAVTAIAIYITIWDKPQGVQVPIFIDADRLLTREDAIKLAARAPKSSMVVHEFWLHGVCVRAMADNVFPHAAGIPIPFTKDEHGHPQHYIPPVGIGIGLGGAIFGAVHCAAWMFKFPTLVEQTLWRVSCIFILASPMPCAFYYLFTQQRAKRSGASETWTRALLLPLVILMPVYLFFRLYLMVEACRALAYPEASIFQDVQWPNFLPHLG